VVLPDNMVIRIEMEGRYSVESFGTSWAKSLILNAFLTAYLGKAESQHLPVTLHALNITKEEYLDVVILHPDS